MTDHVDPAAAEEFSAAAPPHPRARGTGETSFGDAEAPGVGPGRDEEAAPAEPTAGAPAEEQAPGEAAGGEEQAAVDLEVPDDQRSASSERDKAAAGLEGPGDPRSASSEPDKAVEYLELARRTQADFDNYRKRMARENAAAVDRGVTKLAKELLPALDHLDLALRAAAGHEDVIRGFSMVRDELVTALGRVGIEPFSPGGEAFDPSEHEAMAARPDEGAESGTVVEVYQQGYRINGTVLRPARVVVSQ
jgi:molecular chaperone GrpE